MPFEKGNKHGKGRPRAPEVDLVRQAIAETEKEKKKSLWKHLIERCFVEDAVLIAVSKKFLPDLTQTEIIGETEQEKTQNRERVLQRIKQMIDEGK